MPKSCFDITVTLLQGQRPGSRSKVGVKVTGEGQISCLQRSILGALLFRVQQRAMGVIPSLRCLSVISGRVQIIAQMRSIGFNYDKNVSLFSCKNDYFILWSS